MQRLTPNVKIQDLTPKRTGPDARAAGPVSESAARRYLQAWQLWLFFAPMPSRSLMVSVTPLASVWSSSGPSWSSQDMEKPMVLA